MRLPASARPGCAGAAPGAPWWSSSTSSAAACRRRRSTTGSAPPAAPSASRASTARSRRWRHCDSSSASTSATGSRGSSRRAAGITITISSATAAAGSSPSSTTGSSARSRAPPGASATRWSSTRLCSAAPAPTAVPRGTLCLGTKCLGVRSRASSGRSCGMRQRDCGTTLRGQLPDHDLRGRDERHRDQRTDDPEQRRPDDDARDHEEARDVGRAPLDRRLQDVVLELLIADAHREHDERLRDPHRERDEREHDGGDRGAHLRDQAEQPRDDPERQCERDAEQPRRRALNRPCDHRDHHRPEGVPPDRPGDPLLEHLDPVRLPREQHAVERAGKVRQLDHEEQRHERDRESAEAEAEDPPAHLEGVAELRREVGGERLRALLELLAEVGSLVELLEEIGGANPLDDARQVLDQVAQRRHERAHEQVSEHAQKADQAEHDEHRRVAALHAASVHEPGDRRREHDREKEGDEDPENCLACGDECPDEGDDAQHGRHRPSRDRDLDAFGRRLGSGHPASLGPASAGARAWRQATGAPEREMRTSPLTVRTRSSTGDSVSSDGGRSPTSRSDCIVPLTDCASIQSASPGRAPTLTSPETALTRTPAAAAWRSMSPETEFSVASSAVPPIRTSPETVLTVAVPPTERMSTSPDALFVVRTPATAPAERSPLAVLNRSCRTSPRDTSPEADFTVTSPNVPRPSRSELWEVRSTSAPSGQRIAMPISGLRPKMPNRPSRLGTSMTISCSEPRSFASIRVSSAA